MKRNWIIIAVLIGFIFIYEKFVLAPYNQKYAPPPSTAIGSTGDSPVDVKGPAPVPSEAKLQIPENLKKQSTRVDINDSRFFSVFPDGSIGNLQFTKFFTRGQEKRQSVQLVENGLHWRSTDTRVDNCLKSFKREGPLSFKGQADNVACVLQYTPNRLLLDTNIEISSAQAFGGDVFFETDDLIGTGPQFDHRYLGIKKQDEKVDKIRESKLEPAVRSSGPFDWISWGDKYFATILIPKGRFNPDVFHQAGYEAGRVRWGIAYPLRWESAAQKVNFKFDIYFALKDLQELRTVRPDLDGTIDFGYFGPIARFMLWCLESLFAVFKNYGVAIVILSLVVRLLLWPINKRMFESGQKMKEISPQMEAIKKKYEGKSEQMMQMNQEIRALYQQAGVNPLGSCLPIVLQIPIFFGLNSALSNSVDLYQAPFFGWIHDLSYKDPLYILPVVWIISLMISVELTPQPQAQPGMPDMKWIQRIMFIVFGYISKDFPSGLNLYFLISNVAGMSQQTFFRKKVATEKPILLGKEK